MSGQTDDDVTTYRLTEDKVEKLASGAEDAFVERDGGDVIFCNWASWDYISDSDEHYPEHTPLSVESWRDLLEDDCDDITWHSMGIRVVKQDIQTVELTEDELTRLDNGENVTKGGWTFGFAGNIVSAKWDDLRDGLCDQLTWSNRGVAVVCADESEDGETEVPNSTAPTEDEAEEMAERIYSVLLRTDDTADQRQLEIVLDTLGYTVEQNLLREQ